MDFSLIILTEKNKYENQDSFSYRFLKNITRLNKENIADVFQFNSVFFTIDFMKEILKNKVY
jgi:hypothetical protein